MLLIGVLLSACGNHQVTVCPARAHAPQVFRPDVITFALDPAFQQNLDILQVELKQGPVHRAVSFPAQARTAGSPSRQPGVTVHGNGRVQVTAGGRGAALPGPWMGHHLVTLTLDGVVKGQIRYRHREVFTFTVKRTGRGPCAGAYLTHTTSLGPSDALDRPIDATAYGVKAVMFPELEKRIIVIAAHHPGFVDIVENAAFGVVTVIWSGKAPNDLLRYAAARPHGLRVRVQAGAAFSRAELEAGRRRLETSGLVKPLGIVSMSVPSSGRALVVATTRKAHLRPATLARLTKTAGVAVIVRYGSHPVTLY